MDVFVWVDAWQQQCCGKDFRVGSTVRWSVRFTDLPDEWVGRLLGDEWAAKVRFAEGHHADRTDGTLTGTVSEIHVVTCDRISAKPSTPGMRGTVLVPVPGSGHIRSVDVADRWEPESLDPGRGRSFDGWVVRLDAAEFEPTATDSRAEVTP